MRKILADLNKTIASLDMLGLYKESDALNNVFVKVAQLIPGLEQSVQQIGPFVDFQKFTLPKQQTLGNVPVGSNAWNKSIQIALGMAPNMADVVWGPQSQKMLDNFKQKNPSNYDAKLASVLKPIQRKQAPQQPTPTGYTGP
jgi:hypothetical protein